MKILVLETLDCFKHIYKFFDLNKLSTLKCFARGHKFGSQSRRARLTFTTNDTIHGHDPLEASGDWGIELLFFTSSDKVFRIIGGGQHYFNN